jgi:O-antigen/teichoic acid export membrane protein
MWLMWLSVKALLFGQTSVRLNLSANLISKILAALVSLACVPIYIRVLGVAGYGVIGIWATLETLAKLLDLGLSPTMTRELAATARRTEEVQHVRDLVRTIEVFYWTFGFLIGATIMLCAPLIATRWLRSSQMSSGELLTSVQLIGILILCRWPLSFYSSGLSGLERQVLLSWIDFVFALLRSLGAVAVLVLVSPTILAFLGWQIAINILNTGIVAASLWWSLPAGSASRFRVKLLIRVWKFAGGVTAIALVSMLLTDLDKLVVSGLVSLEDFGYYTLASRMAGTLYLAASSVFAAAYPALVRLATEQSEAKLAELYHRAAQMLSLLVFPAAITAAIFASPLIFAWTGNERIADNTAPIAALLIIGTAFHCTGFLPYAVQLAHGWTSLAFWTNVAYVPVTTVLLVVFTKRFGGEGAAAVWVLITTSYYATQIPLMHRRILRLQARQWYINDIGIPLVACSLTAGLLAAAIGPTTTRTGAALTVALAGLLVGAAGLLATPLVRKELRDLWIQYHARAIKIRSQTRERS